MAKAKTNVYTASNVIQTLDIQLSDKAKTLYKQFLLCNGDAKNRQAVANKLCVELCKCFKINAVEIRVCNVAQDYKMVNGVCVSKTMGKYIPSQKMIVIFNKTAVRKQTVAIKTFSNTLLHEFTHHLDHTYLKLNESPHTSGFYKRISSLIEKLK